MVPARTPLFPKLAPTMSVLGLVVSFVLCGCATSAPPPSETDEPAPVTVTPPPGETEVPQAALPGTPVPTPAPETTPARALDPAAAPVVARLAKQLRIDEDEISVAQVARAEWPNSCLGLAAEGEICAQVITPGHAVSLIVNDQRYEFRTDETGRRVRLAFAPLTETGEALVTWKDSASFSVLVLGTQRLAFGLRGGPRLVAPLPGEARSTELLQFVSHFAPFYARTVAGEITFRGVGSEVATPLDHRRIAEWARLVSLESARGEPAGADDRAFVWRRVGGIAGFCDEVVVSRAGWATARPCREPDAEPTAKVELTREELEQLYRWLDTLAPFSWEDDDGATADGLTLHLELAGQGAKPLSEPERERMLEFSNALVRRLLTDGVTPEL